MDEQTRLILEELRSVNNDTGQFVAGILSDDLSRDDQIAFALRLVVLAEHIKDRAMQSPGMIVEGAVIDDDSHTRTGTPDNREAGHDDG